jgi:hypothetical protein
VQGSGVPNLGQGQWSAFPTAANAPAFALTSDAFTSTPPANAQLTGQVQQLLQLLTSLLEMLMGKAPGSSLSGTPFSDALTSSPSSNAAESLLPPPKRKKKDPLTFDLNGNGQVGTTTLENGRFFRLAPGVSRTAWAEAGDGILAFGSGADGSTVLGDSAVIDGRTYANGFEALTALATKHLGAARVAKGYLDRADLLELEAKANLHMKVAGADASADRNARPVGDLGIDRIDLRYVEAGAATDAQGNDHRQQGTFVQNGLARKVDDVFFAAA